MRNTLMVVNFHISHFCMAAEWNKISSINTNGSWAGEGRREYSEIVV